jgi:hypothetical protein
VCGGKEKRERERRDKERKRKEEGRLMIFSL